MAQQGSVAQKIENDVRSTLNANLLKGKSDFSHATWFACVDILFENRFLVVWDQFVSYRGGYWFLSGTEICLKIQSPLQMSLTQLGKQSCSSQPFLTPNWSPHKTIH